MMARSKAPLMFVMLAAVLACVRQAPPQPGPQRPGVELEVVNATGQDVEVFTTLTGDPRGKKAGRAPAMRTSRLYSNIPPFLPYLIIVRVSPGDEQAIIRPILHEKALRVVINSPLRFSFAEIR